MKDGIARSLKKIRIFYIVFNVILIALIILFLLYATQKYIGFIVLGALAIVLAIALRVVYSLKVSMSIVYKIEITGKALNLYTPKQVFSYDKNGACTNVETTLKKYICTFESNGTRDTFVLFRFPPFSSSKEEQFTKEDILSFYPEFSSVKVKK